MSQTVDLRGRDSPVHMATLLLGFSMFMTGACGLVAEYIMGTVATYILGNPIEQMSMTIAFMLLMMGVANFVQARISDDRLVEKFIAVEIAMALLCGFSPILMYAAFAWLEHHFIFAQYSLIGSVGFLIGFELPLATRINEKHQAELRHNIGYMFGLDYLGSFVGALIWVKLLLPHTHILRTGFVIAIANFSVAAVTYAYFRHKGLVASRWWPVALIAGTLAVSVFGHSRVDDWERLLRQRLYDDPIVMAQTTKYQHLVLTRSSNPEDWRLYINGNLQFSSRDEAIYHELLVHPVMSLVEAPKNVLILGGGDGMALREALKYPIESATLVDIDPEMTRLFSTDPRLRALNGDAFADARVMRRSAPLEEDGFAPVHMETGAIEKTPDGPRPQRERVASVRVYNIDATRFVESLEAEEQKWDAIIIDLPDPNSVELAKLYSLEFYLSLHRVLQEGGMIALQATSPYHAPDAFACVLDTVRAARWTAVPYHDNVPSFGDWGWILLSRDADEEELRQRLASIEIRPKTDYLTDQVFRSAMVFGKGRLDGEGGVNTLMHPILLSKYVYHSWQSE